MPRLLWKSTQGSRTSPFLQRECSPPSTTGVDAFAGSFDPPTTVTASSRRRRSGDQLYEHTLSQTPKNDFEDRISIASNNFKLTNGRSNASSRGPTSDSNLPYNNSFNFNLNDPTQTKGSFEVDPESDILKLAAQRDLQKDSNRFANQVMMPPTIHKNTGNVTPIPHAAADQSASKTSDLLQANSFNETRTRSSLGKSPLPKADIQPESIFNTNSRDIMHQSIRRQTLRGFKSNSQDMNNYLDTKIAILGITTPDDFRILKTPTSLNNNSTSDKNYSLGRKSENSRDDIQILNLQGFMNDNDLESQSSVAGLQSRASRNRSRSDAQDHLRSMQGRVSKEANKSLHSRKKKTKSKSKFILGNSEDDGVVLRDIDDHDKNSQGILIYPKNLVSESGGVPITLEQAVELRTILTGNPAIQLPSQWMKQNFKQNKRPSLSYGLVQNQGGPCGVLASVQSYMMKNLMFGSWLTPTMSVVSPLRPSYSEWSWALSTAITEILWQASKNSKAILALPGSFAHFMSYGATKYQPDSLTESLMLLEFSSQDELLKAVQNYLSVFTGENSSGCVLFLYSALLSREFSRLKNDMDSSSHLINSHGYASQEVVNLLITGQASTNAFNGDQLVGENGIESLQEKDTFTPSPSKMILKGVQNKSQVGLLSLFEHYRSYKIGSHLKNPEYPVWVVCSESHYSVLFSRELSIAGSHPPFGAFDLYFYDGLAMQEEEIRLTVDPTSVLSAADPVPPLELCIRTKWPRASVSWNGVEPIL